MKKLMCLIMMGCLLLSSVPFSAIATDAELSPDPEAYPNFALDNWEALYAHATLGGDSTDAWQKWMRDYSGINAEEGVRYFFLPVTADDDQVEIYNGYNEDAIIGDVTVPTHTSAFIDYVEGEAISVTVGETRSYTFKVLRSNAEAALYINDTTNSYKDYEGTIQETDLWNFLIQNKENSVSTATYSIASSAGVEDGDLKKIKGRGNTNWKQTDKKPFNINFDEMTTIGHTTSKKFSLVSNAKDTTLLRNSIMYDLADSVGNPYSPSQSFIDFYVNGVYRGSYIACQKIDLGKNAVVSLKDESEDIATDFNFLVEVDVWNYAADTYFESDRGYHVVLKTPDLEDFETGSEDWQTRFDYIKDTYQELEDALYKGNLSDIEAICDLDSLATQYLLQELGKNCDGGYTSTFFTYNAKEGKFYAAPIWDCDSCLGAVSVWRDNCTTSTADHRGWTTRLAKYGRTINPLGQAFYVGGTTSEGQTFQQLCKDIWNEKFISNIDILLGNTEAPDGSRLKSVDSYADAITSSAYNNYIMWDFMWLCQDENDSLTDIYDEDYEGELQYLKDWIEARAQWMTMELNSESPEPSVPDTPAEDTRVVYFTTELMWENVHFYLWGDGHIPMRWPGNKAENIGTTEEGFAIYKAVVNDVDAQKIIFNDGIDGAQTISIPISNEFRLYHTTDESGRINEAGQPYYNVDFIPYTENTETTPPEETTTTEPEETTATEPEETTATEPEETTATEPPETPTLPQNTLSAFVFDATGKTEGEKLEEYGSKDGYEATFGNGTLTASVNSDGNRALEWSAAEYGDSGEDMIPIVSAGNKNPWGTYPYVQIALSTEGYKDICISLTSAGSKKCPASWQLAYSLDGETFADIEGASYTISMDNRKSPIAYFDNLILPGEVDDNSAVILRLYAVSDTTVSGGTTADDPTGGELAINNIIITGTPLQSTDPSGNILGDADLSGVVNIKDATVIQKHLAGLVTLSEDALAVSDTTRDNKVTVSDATAIQKIVAGLLENF